MERTKTGIKGFDRLLQGGLPQGSSVLLSGTPGTGKTIFGIEFIYNGAVRFREKGLYITFEENLRSIFKQAEQFNWDLKKLIDREQIKFVSIPAEEINNNTANNILDMIKKHRINRIVIDSLSTLIVNSPFTSSSNHAAAMSRFIYGFINKLRKNSNVTSLLISHTTDEKSLSEDNISEFSCDGVVHIMFEPMGGEYSRSLLVRKMRRTKNNEDIHPLEIGSRGLVVHTIK